MPCAAGTAGEGAVGSAPRLAASLRGSAGHSGNLFAEPGDDSAGDPCTAAVSSCAGEASHVPSAFY